MENTQQYGYSLMRLGEHGVEWFEGLDMQGIPRFSDSVLNAQIWENKLHAETQALLLGCQQKAIKIPLHVSPSLPSEQS